MSDNEDTLPLAQPQADTPTVLPYGPAVPMPEPRQVDRAIRLSYAQWMLSSIFGASTGGMFLIGFAMALGADDILLGLMSTVPACAVAFQFLAAWLVQRGISRRKLTIWFAFATPLCWLLIAQIPLFQHVLDKTGRFIVLIGVITLAGIAAQFANNARGSWMGELIPAQRRGRFFGYASMFGGIIGAIFAIIEGRFLDFVSAHGLMAFSALFFFGAIFGLISSSLFIPQPDCPLPGGRDCPPYRVLLRRTIRNRPFVMLAITHAVIALGAISGPFTPAYLLRDVKVTFFNLGLLNALFTAAWLASSPYWGRLADRFGCRPVLVLGLVLMAPCSAIWLGVPPKNPWRAYALLPYTNVLCGLGLSGMSVGLSAMIYKVSEPEGRAVQFAAYSVFVAGVSAPMPVLGGYLVTALQNAGYAIDLRLTFYLWSVFIFAAALVARLLPEPGAVRTRTLVLGYFPSRLAGWYVPSRIARWLPWPRIRRRVILGPLGRPGRRSAHAHEAQH